MLTLLIVTSLGLVEPDFLVSEAQRDALRNIDTRLQVIDLAQRNFEAELGEVDGLGGELSDAVNEFMKAMQRMPEQNIAWLSVGNQSQESISDLKNNAPMRDFLQGVEIKGILGNSSGYLVMLNHGEEQRVLATGSYLANDIKLIEVTQEAVHFAQLNSSGNIVQRQTLTILNNMNAKP